MVHTRATAKRIALAHDPHIQIAPVKLAYAATPRRRRGKPGSLCQLNLDVLFLIGACVRPLDLLHLARTCRSLRQLLMTKAAAGVWKMARGQVEGLPDCPADMTEPEYADLAFCPRCHGCERNTSEILWEIRRRYCSECRSTRLCCICTTNEIVANNRVLPSELLTIGDETERWVDKAQLESFMQEYARQPNKDQFLIEHKARCSTMTMHASQCVSWNRMAMLSYRGERENSIKERLILHGFQRDIEDTAWCRVRDAHTSFFNPSKPLTDNEWAQMWPKWLEIMSDIRLQRLSRTIFPCRQQSLTLQYDHHVSQPSPEISAFDILPNAIDLACFPPFRDIIMAPEETAMGDKPFESAFGQLPDLVDQWRTKLDSELAELVNIPAHLSKGRAATLNTKTRVDATYKLRLASAAFATLRAVCTYPEVLHCMCPATSSTTSRVASQHMPPVGERFGVRFVEDAPYIVHACGLDPHVATADDMDRRNARVRCLVCVDRPVRSWRDALFHARVHGHVVPHTSPRWEAVGGALVSAIQAVERGIWKPLMMGRAGWCLRCCPRVGDAMASWEVRSHLRSMHGVQEPRQEEDHHVVVEGQELCSVEMVVGWPTGKVIFHT